MLSKKYLYLFILIAFFIAGFFFINQLPVQPPLVAITQIAPHPSLDEIRRGIVERLELGGISKDQVVFQNAQGSPATALQIVQKFISLKAEVIVPITTPSAQAAYSLAKNAGIPVIFSAVNDPKAAKLMDDDNKNPMIAGVSDLPPYQDQLKLIMKIMPEVKTVGVIYNGGEANSVSLIKLFEEEAANHTIKIIRSTVTGTNDVSAATMNLVGKVDVIYIPNDNTVISAFDSVIHVTNKNNIPVFTADTDSVTRGAIGAIAHNQYSIGQKTAEMILKHIKDYAPISTLGIQKPDTIELTLNQKVASLLGITLPKDLVGKAKYIVK
ncbi:MAG: ABC transporter substrate-binding protein [Alphaproteobacteria bacterium]|nr:ABC transporter substrate-binding protein [Alphaproteobacteria bacterium]